MTNESQRATSEGLLQPGRLPLELSPRCSTGARLASAAGTPRRGRPCRDMAWRGRTAGWDKSCASLPLGSLRPAAIIRFLRLNMLN